MVTSRFVPAAPYCLERTVGTFARFPSERVDRVSPIGFRRAYSTDTDVVVLEATQEHSRSLDSPVDAQCLNSDSVFNASDSFSLIRRQLAVDEQIDEVDHLLRSNRLLQTLSDPLRGLRRTLDPTPFEGLVSSILAQLISISGAAVVRGRFVEAFGSCVTVDDEEYWTFPAPERLDGETVDRISSLGMTGTKAKAILAVARACCAGELNLGQLSSEADESIVSHLVSFPGIGPWTAEWFLINVMGRMSTVPAGDLGIRRSTGTWMLGGRMPTPAEVREIYDPFGPLRAYVAYYVLSAERYALTPESGIR